MNLGRHVLGMLSLLVEIIIAFHTCSLLFFVLGIGIHACNATGNNNFLDQGAHEPAITGARPAHTQQRDKPGNNSGLNFPQVPLITDNHSDHLVSTGTAAGSILHLHLHTKTNYQSFIHKASFKVLYIRQYPGLRPSNDRRRQLLWFTGCIRVTVQGLQPL